MEAKPRQHEQPFLEAYDAHADAIFRYCFFQTSKREVALDITQDTFIRAWEYLEKGEMVENMKAFLYRIAGNLVIDYRRKKKSDSLDRMIEDGFDVGFDEHGKIEKQFEGREVLQIIEQIPEIYKDVLIMRFVDDMSIPEIAEVTGETENNISVRIHRGLEKLEKEMEKKNK
jgi:RNA polymerase sigma-70 factor (ECF subfamily)